MDNAIGKIFKINRSKTDVKIWQLSQELSIPQSKISEFENGKRVFPDKTVHDLYKCLNIEYRADIDLYDDVVDLVMQLFNCIYQRCDDVHSIHDSLIKQKDLVRFNHSYITWLLGDFLYMTYYPAEYDYENRIKILLQHEAYLDSRFIPIMYDAFGVYYKNNKKFIKAIDYLDKAMQYNICESTTGMICYHKSMILVDHGKLWEATVYINKAKVIFDSTMNLYRSIMARVELGIIHGSLRHFEYANELFIECIDVYKNMDSPNIIYIYNNLLFNLLLWGRFEKVTELGEEAIAIEKTYPNTYFYMAYAYWKLGNIEKMKLYREKMRSYEKYSALHDLYLYNAFYTYVSNRSAEIKEKKLVKAFNEADKSNKISQCLFIVELLVALYKKENNSEKIIFYQDLMIDLYKKLK